MKVYRARGVLNSNEIDDIFRFEEESGSKLGQTRRDAKGVKRLDGTWKTTYLQTDHSFQQKFPILFKRLVDVARVADKENGWNILQEPIHARVIELHTLEPGAGLPEKKHHDFGSLVTVDVMCSERSSFKGGELATLEENGQLDSHHFEKGDAIVFPSHKFHCVGDLQEGKRQVLVMELWNGEERRCAHRCMKHLGECTYSVNQSRFELLATSAMPEIDPW